LRVIEPHGHPLGDLYAATDDSETLGDGWRPLAGRSLWAQLLLGATALVSLIALLSDFVTRGVVSRDPALITLADLQAIDDRDGLIGVVTVAVILVTGIVFLTWLHRAARNLTALGATGLRFTPGWSVGYWFVPILNLWRPKQIVDDLWRASDADGDEWRSDSTPGLTLLWWPALLLSGFLARASASADIQELSDLQRRNGLDLASDTASLVAAIVAILLVRAVTARQEGRAEQLSPDAAH
jgi:hypothetical protein